MGGLSIAEKKNLIMDKINNIYINYAQILYTKEEFFDAFEQSFNRDLLDYLKDNTLIEFYNSQINKNWERIENERANLLLIQQEAKIKYQSIYEQLLWEHKEEIMEIQKKYIRKKRRRK